MSPVTHFFAGWLLASVSPTGRPATLTRREKALVVAASVAPDIDGLGIIPELLTRNTSHPLLWFSEYHHSLHTLAFALFCTLAAYIIAGPMAEKLGLKSKEEAFIKEIILQGVLSIQAGNNPRVVEMQLMSFLSSSQQAAMPKAA